jgi:hypothetical protein
MPLSAARKPGGLRNGAPFKDWALPAPIERVRRKLRVAPDGDRQTVEILSAALADGLPAVEAACAEARENGVQLRRRRAEHPRPPSGHRPAPANRHARGAAAGARTRRRLRPIRQPEESRLMERSDILAAMGQLKLHGMRSAYDGVEAAAVKRQHEPQKVVGDLLRPRSTGSRRDRSGTR